MKAAKRSRPLPAPPTPAPPASTPTIACRRCGKIWRSQRSRTAPAVDCTNSPCPAAQGAAALARRLAVRREWLRKRRQAAHPMHDQ